MLKRISQAEYSRSYSGKPERLGNRWMKHRLLVERRYNKVIDVGLSDHARFHLLRWAAPLAKPCPIYSTVTSRPWLQLDVDAFPRQHVSVYALST